MRGQGLFLLGLAAASGALGCNLIAEIQEGVLIGASGGSGGAMSGGTGGAGGQVGGSTAQGGAACDVIVADECQTCLFGACESDYCACAAESDCAGFSDCQIAGEPLELCWQKYPKGIAAAGNLQACGHDPCNACGFGPVTDCAACLYKKCPDEVNACFSNPGCYGYYACIEQCQQDGGTPSECTATCNEQFPDGAATTSKLDACQKASCAGECPF